MGAHLPATDSGTPAEEHASAATADTGRCDTPGADAGGSQGSARSTFSSAVRIRWLDSLVLRCRRGKANRVFPRGGGPRQKKDFDHPRCQGWIARDVGD